MARRISGMNLILLLAGSVMLLYGVVSGFETLRRLGSGQWRIWYVMAMLVLGWVCVIGAHHRETRRNSGSDVLLTAYSTLFLIFAICSGTLFDMIGR